MWRFPAPPAPPIVTGMVTGPLVIRRVVKWGECDPAGIVYTPRFLDWVIEACEDCFRHITGLTWSEHQSKRGMGHPLKAVNIEFHSPLKSGETFEAIVLIDRVGRSALGYRVEGRKPDGMPCFTGTATAVIVDYVTYRPREMPDDYRDAFAAYRALGVVASKRAPE